MSTPLVIHGRLTPQGFVADEPIPDIKGPAELIVYPTSGTDAASEGPSISDFFGKAPHLRSGEDIDAQIEEARSYTACPRSTT